VESVLCGRMTVSPMAFKIREAIASWPVEAINGLAEVVTGDCRRFYRRGASTPGPALPPVKWRTVE
jgi:hypothetical protein